MTDLALVTAVVTILIVRGALAAAGFPQVGGSTLHIAHLLWGGLLMVLAFGVLLQAADRIWKPFAAFVFGIGLGLFLDEIGKFITKDNDYFYKPAVAVMYVVLMMFFLLTHAADRLDRTPPQEGVYFAAQAVSHLTLEGLSSAERREALERLEKSGIDTELAQGLRQILTDAKPTEENRAALWLRLERARDRLTALAGQQRVQLLVVWFFILSAAVTVATVLFANSPGWPHTFSDWTQYAWQVAAGVFTVVGAVLWLRAKRLVALRMFYAATLVTLLFGQVYTFADTQFNGLFSLIGNLICLAVLRVAIAGGRSVA